MTLFDVALTADEVRTLLSLVHTRLADLERMQDGLQEGLGMDAQRHNALRTLGPQVEAMQDLALKLEGAAHEARDESG